MYELSSLVIASVLFITLVIIIEASYYLGRRLKGYFSETDQSHFTTIQAALLTVLGLLLGFTFSQSLERYDSRSKAVVTEANAIGTVYLRAQVIAPSLREPTTNLIRKYVDKRIQLAEIALDHPENTISLLKETERLQGELWDHAQQAAAADQGPISALFIQAVNELIDSYGKRKAELERHVPDLVMYLLLITLLLTCFVVGISSGVQHRRPAVTSFILMLLFVLLVYAIIDLDRPRRGLIRVPHHSLNELQASINTDVGH